MHVQALPFFLKKTEMVPYNAHFPTLCVCNLVKYFGGLSTSIHRKLPVPSYNLTHRVGAVRFILCVSPGWTLGLLSVSHYYKQSCEKSHTSGISQMTQIYLQLKFLEMVLGQRIHTRVILKTAAQGPCIYRGPSRETEVL